MIENYSKKVLGLFKSKKISIGDRILIKRKKDTFEGRVMPRPEVGDSEAIVIKLDSGYNIGIRYYKGITVKKIKSGKFERPKLEKIKKDNSLPTISLITTGGTILSRVDYKTGGVKSLESPEELLSNIPELKKL